MRNATNAEFCAAYNTGAEHCQMDLESGLRLLPNYAASANAKAYTADVELQAEYRRGYVRRFAELQAAGKIVETVREYQSAH